MKVLSLNLHGFLEEDHITKQNIISKSILDESIDLVLIQEYGILESGVTNLDAVMKTLKENNSNWEIHHTISHWAKFDNGLKYLEGVAILTKHKVDDIDTVVFSKSKDVQYWNKRNTISLSVEDITYISVHIGFDTDDETWQEQTKRFLKWVDDKRKVSDIIFGGDFNKNASDKDIKVFSNYKDTFLVKNPKLNEAVTLIKRDVLHETNVVNRIDYIFTSLPLEEIESSELTLNKPGKIVSDHCGVLTSFKIV